MSLFLTRSVLGHLLHYGRELNAMDPVIGIMLVIVIIGLLADKILFRLGSAFCTAVGEPAAREHWPVRRFLTDDATPGRNQDWRPVARVSSRILDRVSLRTGGECLFFLRKVLPVTSDLSREHLKRFRIAHIARMRIFESKRPAASEFLHVLESGKSRAPPRRSVMSGV